MDERVGGGPGESSTPVGLLERDRELAELRRALDAAVDGQGELVFVEGPAGAGKTSLLRCATEMAREQELPVLSARVTELGRSLSFGVARQLFEGVLRRAAASERERLLSGSAELAAPCLGFGVGSSAEQSAAASLHGLYWLLCNLLDAGPALLVVDDAQWCDPASADLLRFLVPRVADLPCLLIVAARSDEPDTLLQLGATASDPASHPVTPAPLTAAACALVLERELDVSASSAFAEACHSATGGNPFLVHALVTHIGHRGIATDDTGIDAVYAAAPRIVTRSVLARLGALGEQALDVCRALAVTGPVEGAATLAALAEMSTDSAQDVVDDLDRAGLVIDGERTDFVHPLIGNAVYADLDRTERHRLHRRAAQRIDDEGGDVEEVAAHLLQTIPGRDVALADTLSRAARRSVQRGSPATAIESLRRALREDLPDDRFADLLVEVGLIETTIDIERAVLDLERAIELTDNPVQRLLALGVLSRSLFFVDRHVEAAAVAAQALDELGPERGDLHITFEALLLASAQMEPEIFHKAAPLAGRVRGQPPTGTDLASQALAAGLAHLDARSGRTSAREATEAAQAALRGVTLVAEDNGRAAFLSMGMVLVYAESDQAAELTHEGTRRAVASGDQLGLAGNRILSCLAHLAHGELIEAVAAGDEALRHSDECGTSTGLPWAAACLAQAHLATGDIVAAEAALERARDARGPRDSAHWHLYRLAMGQVAAAHGHHRVALDHFLDAGESFARVGGANPAFLPWRTHAAAACLAADDADRAADLVAAELASARAWGAPGPIGRALRVQARLAPPAERERVLAEAVDLLEISTDRVAEAGALIDLGAELRRSGRRRDAREPLRRGLDLARRCGASPEAARAADELRASGAKPRTEAVSGVESLTPSQLRVVKLAAEGSRNREIAQQLFVTEKTVEFHLTQAYRKLDITSREQLTVALSAAR